MCLTYVETRLRRVLPLQVAAGAVAATAAAAASAMPGLSSDGNPTGSPPPGRWNVLPPWLLTPRPPAPRSTPGSSGGGRKPAPPSLQASARLVVAAASAAAPSARRLRTTPYLAGPTQICA